MYLCLLVDTLFRDTFVMQWVTWESVFGLKTSREKACLGLREETGGKRGNKAWEEGGGGGGLSHRVAFRGFQIENHSCNLKISTLLIVKKGQSIEQKKDGRGELFF